MHALKGGWVGQTFALAKCNDSGGRRSRIRRSKEERKAMVECFIKKYQKFNNGSFPSLNLTHKEVGGSFYTVREIVREIIQENKVLGPATLTPKGQNSEIILEQYPLGSIAIEPETDSLSSKGVGNVVHILPNHHHLMSEELPLNSDIECDGPELQRVNDKEIINGSCQAIEKHEDEEQDKAAHTDLKASGSVATVKNVGELGGPEADITSMAADAKVSGSVAVVKNVAELAGSEAQVTNMATEKTVAEVVGSEAEVTGMATDAKVGTLEIEKTVAALGETEVISKVSDLKLETFLLTSASKATYRLDGKSSQTNEVAINLVGKESAKPEQNEDGNNLLTDSTDSTNILEESSGLGVESAEASSASPTPSLAKNSDLVDKNEVHDHGTPLSGSLNGSATIKEHLVESSCGTDHEVKSIPYVGIKPVNASDGLGTQNLSSIAPSNSHVQSISNEAVNIQSNHSANHGGSSEKGNSPTLDRINLESWKGPSKKSSVPEASSLLVFLKSLVAAFVKFWSE